MMDGVVHAHSAELRMKQHWSSQPGQFFYKSTLLSVLKVQSGLGTAQGLRIIESVKPLGLNCDTSNRPSEPRLAADVELTVTSNRPLAVAATRTRTGVCSGDVHLQFAHTRMRGVCVLAECFAQTQYFR